MTPSALCPAWVAHSGRWLTAVTALALGSLRSAPAADAPVQPFHVGLARSAFSNVNRNDALAAYSALLDRIAGDLGYKVKATATLYEDTPAFAAAIKRGMIHLASMDAWQFLDLERAGMRELRPYFVPAVNGRIGRRYVVVARRGSGLRTIGDLAGKTVLRLNSVDNHVCRAWLATLLAAAAPAATAEFFAAMEGAAKPMTAVLPVFFGQKDACVLDEPGFALMKELNPQIGKTLEVIVSSDRFVDNVTCLAEQPWTIPGSKEKTVGALADLAADPAGRQILALFRISGLVAFEPEQLDTVRALRRAHEQRPGATPRGGTSP